MTLSLAMPGPARADIFVLGGSTTEVFGTGASETIAVTCSGGNIKVNGQDPSGDTGPLPFPCSGVRFINVLGHGGDDVIDFRGVTAAAGFTNPGLRRNSATFATGHEGRDTAFAGQFSMEFSGGPGRDVALGSAADDFLDGGNGGDRLSGFDGDDTFAAGAGDDRLFGGAGREIRIFGASGDDVIHGGAGRDGVVGGPGDDRLYGDAGNDAAFGAQGIDLCRAEYVDTLSCER